MECVFYYVFENCPGGAHVLTIKSAHDGSIIIRYSTLFASHSVTFRAETCCRMLVKRTGSYRNMKFSVTLVEGSMPFLADVVLTDEISGFVIQTQ